MQAQDARTGMHENESLALRLEPKNESKAKISSEAEPRKSKHRKSTQGRVAIAEKDAEPSLKLTTFRGVQRAHAGEKHTTLTLHGVSMK